MATSTNLTDLSIVIPVFNSSRILPELIAQLDKTLPLLAQQYETILVNDGSRDDSWKTIEQLCRQYSWLQGVNMMRNYGQHNALLCGIRLARYPIIVTMDDDLQHPPDQIHLLLEKLQDYDVVYGSPIEEQHGLWRDLASILTKSVLKNFMGAEAAQNISAFRAFRTHVQEAFAQYHGSLISIDVLLTWGATRFGNVRVHHDLRKEGKSNYSFTKLVRHAVNMITGFSVLPLQISSVIGFLTVFFGILVMSYVIGRYIIEGGSVPGFPFLASIITIFAGAQLFSLGIIGEYLARIHFRTMEKPSYVVRQHIRHGDN